MYTQVLPTLLAVAVFAFLGLPVAHNQNWPVNNLFVLFVTVDSLWLLSVFAVIFTRLGIEPFYSRVVCAASMGLMMAVQAFTHALLEFRQSTIYKAYFYGFGGVVLLLTLATGLIIRGVYLQPGHTGTAPFPQYGALFLLFLVYLGSSLLSYFFVLVRGEIVYRTGVVKRRQLRIVSIGLAVFAASAL